MRERRVERGRGRESERERKMLLKGHLFILITIGKEVEIMNSL